MMRGGREEGGKVTAMSPLFPRLHVNDAVDRGGPRAPPRNKMALYEQFTVPSQRFATKKSTSSVAAAASAAAASSSSSQQSVSKATSGCGQEGTVFSSYCLPSQFPACTKNGTALEMVKSSPKSGPHRTFNSLKSDEHVPSSMNSNHFPKPDSKSSGRKRGLDDEDFRVPTFVQRKRIPSSDKDRLLIKNTSFERIFETGAGDDACNTADQLPISGEKPPEGLVHISLASRKCERDYSQKKNKETKEHGETFRRPDLLKVSDGKTVEPFKPSVSADCENENVGIIDLEKPPIGETKICSESGQDCSDNFNIGLWKYRGISEYKEGRESSEVQMSDSKSPLNFKILEDGKKEDDGFESLNQRYAEKIEDSETSVLDSASGFGISPDNVAGMIGAKHFWKARRVILNQQRVFALQVFELHRLIKVQKLIAASPQELVRGPYGTKSTAAASRDASDSPAESQRPNRVEKNDSQKANGPPSPPTCNGGSQKSRNVEQTAETSKEDPSRYLDERIHQETGKAEPSSSVAGGGDVLKVGLGNGTHSGTSAPSENSATPWCFPPAGNQWLIPVMSPSEGLVYKPCMGPYPPPMGFVSPMFGGCGPPGDLTMFGFPAPHHQQSGDTVDGARMVAPSFYPLPCGFPPASSSVDASQTNNRYTQPPKEEETGTHLRRSGSRCCLQASREIDFLRGNENFMVGDGPRRRSEAPTSSSSVEQQSRVIKVVPHNPRIATESVARIFKCIQREKQLCDSV